MVSILPASAVGLFMSLPTQCRRRHGPSSSAFARKASLALMSLNLMMPEPTYIAEKRLTNIENGLPSLRGTRFATVELHQMQRLMTLSYVKISEFLTPCC